MGRVENKKKNVIGKIRKRNKSINVERRYIAMSSTTAISVIITVSPFLSHACVHTHKQICKPYAKSFVAVFFLLNVSGRFRD